jgi:hypothetical protein
MEATGQSTYLVYCPEAYAVKIGVARCLAKRLKSLQGGCPFELIPVVLLRGDREKELHKRFAKHRIRHEWFRMCDELAAFIVSCPLIPIVDSFPDIHNVADLEAQIGAWVPHTQKQLAMSVASFRDSRTGNRSRIMREKIAMTRKSFASLVTPSPTPTKGKP